MRVPVILPFETRSGNHYLYDDCTGMVFPGSPALVDVIRARAESAGPTDSLRSRYPPDDLEEALRFVTQRESHYSAFYRTDSEREASARAGRDVSSQDVATAIEEAGFRHLVLTLTENCNLRCRYCAFSDVYALTRNRTERIMSLDVGRRAIDYFFARASAHVRRNPSRIISIGFYGGEPLLAQAAMQQLVSYALAHAPCPIVFTITTNGTLLHGDIANLLVRHEFSIFVSLDGCRANHDRNRVFPDGQGSFDVVMANVAAFKQRFRDYKKLYVDCVIDWRTDLATLDEFFESHTQKVPPISRLSFVRPDSTTYYERFSHSEQAATLAALLQREELYAALRMDGRPPTDVQRALFDERYCSLLRRPRHGNTRYPFLPFTACCVPGTKLSVRADGHFDICERVNGTWPIGHVDRGVDVSEVAALVREYNQTVCERCWRCPITKVCPLCFAATERRHTFEQSERDCEILRQMTAETFGKLYSILEAHPDAFEEHPVQDVGREAVML